jgi:mRNA-degrading endonuclease toxin of MazEF toxin-antitoxin module
VKRGDIVLVSLPGNCGKPRPALVVQADLVPGALDDDTLTRVNRALALWLGLAA